MGARLQLNIIALLALLLVDMIGHLIVATKNWLVRLILQLLWHVLVKLGILALIINVVTLIALLVI
jgi:hypothetical protein